MVKCPSAWALDHARQQIVLSVNCCELVCAAGRVYTHADAVGAIAQREGIPYLLDATQAVGQMPVDVRALECDYLTSTGRKFLRGPRGTGFLFASRLQL